MRRLAAHLRDTHPDPFHAVSERRFRQAVDRAAERAGDLSPDALLVELMRLGALPGARDGHSGIFPLDEGHERELHLFGVRVHDFADGPHVVAQAGGRDELVGARVVSVAGVPWARIAEAVEPLVPRDNRWSLRARVPLWAVTAEVLHGLDLIASAGPAEWAFERDGKRFTQTLRPVAARDYAAAFEDLFAPQVPPALPAREPRGDGLWTRRTGAALLVGYDVTLEQTGSVAARVRRHRGPVVVDVRRNPGGNNNTYEPLLKALRGRDVIVLISRGTFSAAANFVTELERAADVTFVGEPTGGSPNLYGDPAGESLPASGLYTHAATVYWEMSSPDDRRPAIAPDVPVEVSARDYFSGSDPVLEAARRLWQTTSTLVPSGSSTNAP